jgi:hypothetical protein
LDYLAKEESIEREIYSLDAADKIIIASLRSMYDIDERRVARSANRNYGADPSPDAPGQDVSDADSGEEDLFVPV